MTLDPQTLTYSGLGASALALAAYMLWSVARRSGDLDSRAIKMVDAATKPLHDVITRLDAIVADERAEKLRAQEERGKAVQALIDQTMQQHREHAAEVKLMREEHIAATQRMHARLDDCDGERRGQDAKIAALVEKLTAANQRIDKLEDRERSTLRDAPPPGQPAITIMPMAVPAGHTITPTVGAQVQAP